jgi:carboxyl-terminal processing protease
MAAHRANPLFWAVTLSLCVLTACGGGGSVFDPQTGSGVGSSSSSSAGDGWVQGVYLPESQYAARCQNPRTGTDPITGQPYPDVQGTTLDENFWLRSWTNDWYLWYSEVPDIDPGTYSDPLSYFAVLKTSALDSLGEPKDKFHFTYATSQWEALTLQGADIGYGLTWAYVYSGSTPPPRQIYAAYVWPGYSAAATGVERGYEVVSIDGVSINANDQTSLDTLNEALSPTSAGESHQFVFLNTVTNANVNVTLQAAQVTETPVALTEVLSTPAGPVGYILYNDLAVVSSEQELIDAINTLKAANVTDLVLDLRYNGGGFEAIASELAYMIAGPGPTAATYFEKETFNSKHLSTDPDGAAITPTPFLTTTQPGFSTQNGGTPLPYLGLSRLFVITGTDTCSASEAIMNALNGVGVEVIQIGSTTCGKPYGFYPPDNCGTTYFAIEFEGDNFAGFGDYPDGFTPQNSSVAAQLDPKAVLPGCSVADDFENALGNQSEGRLAAALAYAAGGSASCPAPSGLAPPETIHGLERSMLHRPPWRTIRILRPPVPR